MKRIKRIYSVENDSYLVGHFQTWYYNGKLKTTIEIDKEKKKGIEVNDEEKFNYMDVILKNKGIFLDEIGFYGIIGEEKIFDLSSYLFNRAVITLGKKKNLEGRLKINSNIPVRIARVIAQRKTDIRKIAKIFELPMK